MEAYDVLGHLLAIEAQASALVQDAEAQAHKRITLCSTQNRQLYAEVYRKEAAVLDSEYQRELAAIQDGYNKQLEAYRTRVSAAPVDQNGFSRLLDRLLLLETPLSKEQL
ncbi:hypothetical protein ACYULU_10345 [Breznakiellaceae bacterium SP9]